MHDNGKRIVKNPLVLVYLIQTYHKKYIDIYKLNRKKKLQCNLFIWGQFYEVVYRDGGQISKHITRGAKERGKMNRRVD